MEEKLKNQSETIDKSNKDYQSKMQKKQLLRQNKRKTIYMFQIFFQKQKRP